MASGKNLLIRRVPLGLLVSTAAFWVGAFRLVVFSTKVLLQVIRGDHPYDAVRQLRRTPPGNP